MNQDITLVGKRACPMPTGIAFDQQTKQMKVIGSDDFCNACKMFDVIAGKCSYLILFERNARIEAMMIKIYNHLFPPIEEKK